MDIKRLQNANQEFKLRTIEAEAEAKELKVEASVEGEAIEALKLKQVELESEMEQLTTANKDLTIEVYLSKFEVNATMKRVENSNNLQKIASMSLKASNKKKVELKAKVE